jgi:hypothetical protein
MLSKTNIAIIVSNTLVKNFEAAFILNSFKDFEKNIILRTGVQSVCNIKIMPVLIWKLLLKVIISIQKTLL